MNLLDLLFPPRCAVCGRLFDYLTAGEKALCPVCLTEWNRLARRSQEEIHNDDLIHLTTYYSGGDELSNRLILKMKQKKCGAVFDLIGRQLSDAIRARIPLNRSHTLITYAPRTRDRKQEFGFDHAEQIARRTARNLGIECHALLQNCSDTTQKPLKARERRSNAQSAYRLIHRSSDQIFGKTVILLDDITTTGSTLSACSALLSEADAERIYHAVIAVAIRC